jgi:hypothetical protein
VVKAVVAAGGSYADGGTFFRVAVIQTARLLHSGQYPADFAIFLVLKNLALSQYRDWLSEKGQESTTIPEYSAEDSSLQALLPAQEAMREIRQQVRAKRQFTKLNLEDQRQMLSLANSLAQPGSEATTLEISPFVGSIDRYKTLLEERNQIWESPLPPWVVTPLTDSHFHQIWSACEALERRLYSSQIPASSENKTIRNAFIVFVLLTLGYAVYTWISRDRTPTEVYENNFQPPASLLEDLAARYAKDSLAPIRPEACVIAFTEADAFYKKREWRNAATALAAVLTDSLAPCHSDAYFYLAIVGLQLERPELTLDCIAKIEDLDRFGEDIYWYMALAYVKIAAQDSTEKETARRAVERALSNTEIPERRIQAEKMLEELAE